MTCGIAIAAASLFMRPCQSSALMRQWPSGSAANSIGECNVFTQLAHRLLGSGASRISS